MTSFHVALMGNESHVRLNDPLRFIFGYKDNGSSTQQSAKQKKLKHKENVPPTKKKKNPACAFLWGRLLLLLALFVVHLLGLGCSVHGRRAPQTKLHVLFYFFLHSSSNLTRESKWAPFPSAGPYIYILWLIYPSQIHTLGPTEKEKKLRVRDVLRW